MENRKKLLVVLFCLAALQAEARLRNPFSRSQAPGTSAQVSGEIPFRLVHSSLVVAAGSLNGVHGRSLLIDTGTNPTVLDVAVARRLGVKGMTGDLLTLGGGIQGTNGVLASVALGPMVARSVPVFVANLSFLTDEIGQKIDAVIGLDVLKASSFSIDYQRQRIIFGPSPPYKDSVPFSDGPPMITVNMQIQGEMKKLLVDTGAEGLFLFAESPASPVQPGVLHDGSHISLTRTREQVEISNVQLGTLRRKKLPAYVVHMPGGAPRQVDGLLGMTALGVSEVVFDFDRGRLGWR